MMYLITSDALSSSLIAVKNRGVDVIIDDDWMAEQGSDYQMLLNAGVDIRGDNVLGTIHEKVMIIDGSIIVTGSYNWSESAENSNDENILILRSQIISNLYASEFNRIWAQTVA